MKLYNAQTKQYEDVPDDQVQEKVLSGSHGFDPNTQVPVADSFGDIKLYSPQEVGALLNKGGRIASHGELEEQELQKQYGGLGGQAIAAAEGAASGVSVGLSTPLAIGAARAFGGEEAAEKTRQHLEKYKAANPKSAIGGEVVGTIAPIIASGGAAALEEGAGRLAAEGGAEVAATTAAKAAARPSLLSTIARSTPAAITDRIGAAATSAAENVLGAPVAKSALGRIAKAAASHAVGDAVQGAIYGAGGQLSEDALGNHEITASKTIAAMGHGALWGLLLGGGLAGVGAGAKEVAAPALRKASPFLEKAAGEQMSKAMGMSSSFAKKAERYGLGGSEEIGRTVLEETGIGAGPLHKAIINKEEIAEKIGEARSRIGQELEDMRAKMGAAEVKVSAEKQAAAFDSAISKLKGDGGEAMFGREGAVAQLEKYKADWLRSTGVNLPTGVEGPAAAESDFTKFLKNRKELDNQIKWSATPGNDPHNVREMLKEIRGKLSDVESEALGESGERLGGPSKADYLALKKKYQRIAFADDAMTDALGREVTKPAVSLKDMMVGMSGAVLGAAHGHVLGALEGLAHAGVHHAVHEHGNALAAVTLSKIAHMDFLARSVNAVDHDIEAAAGTLVGKAGKARPARFTGPDAGAAASSKWKHAYRSGSENVQVTSEHLDKALPGLSTHAPQVSRAILRKANAAALYMSMNRPKPLNKPTLVDPRPEPRVSATDAEGHYERVRAVEDPVGTLAEGLETGRLSAVQVQAIKTVHPEILDAFREKILDVMAKPHGDISPEKVRVLEQLFDGAGDQLSDPAVKSVMQATYAQQPAAGPPSGQVKPASAKPIQGSAIAGKTKAQAVQERGHQ